jgi:type VI secretion system protein ImpA
MSVIDVEKHLQPVTDESPCGEDMEYETAFQELERAATVEAGGSMLDDDAEPEPPKWPDVAKMAEILLGQTKDLRVTMYLTDARLNTHGVVGLGNGISLIKGFLTGFWEEVHPQLDAGDNDDPTMRINSLAALGDADGLVKSLREVPLVKAKRAGNYSLRDIRIAAGELPGPAGAEPPESGVIDAAFQECELDDLKESSEAVVGAVSELREIEAHLTAQVGAANNSLDVKILADELNAISKIYAEQLTNRGVDVQTGEADEEGQAAGGGKAISGDIRSRADAIRMIDKISEYFRRNEPSSPVPLLLQRAKGLVAKDFMEILKDLTPDAISQAEMFSSSKDKN